MTLRLGPDGLVVMVSGTVRIGRHGVKQCHCVWSQGKYGWLYTAVENYRLGLQM